MAKTTTVVRFPRPQTLARRLTRARALARRSTKFREDFQYWSAQYLQNRNDAEWLQKYPCPTTVREAADWRARYVRDHDHLFVKALALLERQKRETRAFVRGPRRKARRVAQMRARRVSRRDAAFDDEDAQS